MGKEIINRIRKEHFERHSGCDDSWYSRIPYIKREHYQLEKDIYLGGDQPKVFAKIYQYGPNVRKSKQATWPLYLAKFARKFYPVESITEQVFTVLGKALCVEMADTQLVVMEGQLRLASRYFLTENERLFHGADLLSKYLEDQVFIDLLDANKMDGELFSCEDARSAIAELFPSAAYELLCKFDQMLVLDCILGVNDRHYYNWGIITDVTGENPPRFAPLFDTSRGLLWNQTEKQLARYVNKKDRDRFVETYVLGSKAQLSALGLNQPSHFDLIKKLNGSIPGIKLEAEEILKDCENRLLEALYQGFQRLLSANRLNLIEEVLKRRISLTLSHLGL